MWRAVQADVAIRAVALLLAALGVVIAFISLLDSGDQPLFSPPAATPSREPGDTVPTHGGTPSATVVTPPVIGRVEIVVVPAPAVAAERSESDGAPAWLTSLGTLLVGVAALLALLRRPPVAPPPPAPPVPAPSPGPPAAPPAPPRPPAPPDP
jgi:Wiskott-Aldrich syndrome protein